MTPESRGTSDCSWLCASDEEVGVGGTTPHDANGNQRLEYGEQSSFDMIIKNLGNVASSQATATLSTRTSQFVTIYQNTATIPALNPNQSADLNEVFDITLSNDVPN